MAENRIGRRGFLRTAALAGMGAALGACAPKTVEKVVKETVVVEKEKQATVIVKETAAPVKEQVVVTVLISGEALTEPDSFAEAQLWTVYLMEYNLKKTGTIVRYEPWPSSDEYETKLRLLTSSGELQDHIVWARWDRLAPKVRDKLYMPLDELLNSAGVNLADWHQESVKLFKFNPDTNRYGEGPVWVLPGMGNPGVNFLYFNVDALEAASLAIPTAKTTWAEVVAAADKITQPDKGVFGIQVIDGHGNGDYAWLAPFGGSIIDAEGKKCVINSDACVNAYNVYYDMCHKTRSHALPSDMQAMGGYKSGGANSKLLMYRSGAWGARWFLLREQNEKPKMGYDLCPTTYDASTKGKRGNTLSVDGFGISVNAKHPAECMDVLTHFTSKEAGIFSINAGNPLPWPRMDVLTASELDNFPVTKVTAQGILEGEVPIRAANGRDTEINTLLSQRLQVIELEKKVPDRAFLDGLAAEVQEILDQPPA